MIEVERVNGKKMLLNPDLIQFIEAAPDTVVTLSGGDKLLLKTSPEEILDRIVAFRKRINLPEIKRP